ncbi:hypothetical protein D3C86_1223220 [compost metagenome]
MPLEQDHWLAVVEEAGAFRLNFVDRVDAGQRHAEAFGGVRQVDVFKQPLAVSAGECGLRLAAGDAIGDQANLELVGTHGGFGDVTVIAIDDQPGAVLVEVLLQDTHCLRAVAVAEGGHS